MAVGIAIVATASFSSIALTPTPQMIEQFKQLPKSEQLKLAKQYGIDISSLTGGSKLNRNDNNDFEEPIVKPRTAYFDADLIEDCSAIGSSSFVSTKHKKNTIRSSQSDYQNFKANNGQFSRHVQMDGLNSQNGNLSGQSRGLNSLNNSGQQNTNLQPRPENQPNIICKTTIAGNQYFIDNLGKKYTLNNFGTLTLAKVNDKQQKTKKPLQIFGLDMFAGEPTTFAPISDVPVPSEYMVGPGDTINVQTYGKESDNFELVVQRNGTVQLPQVGPISIVGLSFAEAKKLIKDKIKSSTIGVESSVTLGQLRSIRIFIAGEAYKPGSYTVSSLSTITQALYVSGGISNIGSLRNIELKRAGKLVGKLDLYDLLMRGDSSSDLRLQSGDVVFIPAAKAYVSVDGDVRRPAIYELKKDENFADVINMASGLKAKAFAKAISVERFNKNHLKTVISVDYTTTQGRRQNVKDGDYITVSSSSDRLENSVEVAGAATRPGQYQWTKGMRVSDIFHSVRSDLSKGADLTYAVVLRAINEQDEVEVLQFSLNNAIKFNDSKDNLLLEPRDKIVVFKDDERQIALLPIIQQLKKQTHLGEMAKLVEVNGSVRYPGVYPLVENGSVRDLLTAAGGLEEGSYTLSAELTRQQIDPIKGAKIIHKELNLNDVLHVNHNSLKLQSRDVISVRKLPDWQQTRWVSIKGEVRFPGTYSIQRGETLKNVITRAGGLTPNAFTYGSIFLRESIKEKEQEQVRNLADELRREIAAKALTKDGTTISYKDSQQMLDQLQNIEVVGRLSIDLSAILGDIKSADIELEANDELYIPSKNQTVSVMGQVQYPSTHRFIKGETFEQYLSMAGGARKRADEGRSYILRANGSVVIPDTGFLSAGTRMMPGDTIIVPLDTEYKDTLTLWQQVTSVVYNSAVAIASIARINN
ncbi:SLBB domain-containing protein [Parashewanella curva]|uniref:SLBB domain-containing protein n=1 Tax=Parashewanella curva TaxID=2338552 RepID=UPI003A599223